MLKIIFLFLFLHECNSGHFNESEYDRMPPLFGLDPTYDQCLKQEGGVYCVAKFDLVAEPHNELMIRIKEYSQQEIKHYNHSFIDRAICVTQSCKKFTQNRTLDKEVDLSEVLEECVNNSVWNEYGLEAKLSQMYSCDKHGNGLTIDLFDWSFAALLFTLLLMNLIGSVYDAWNGQRDGVDKVGNPYLLSFSIFRNWKQLSSTDIHPTYERLKGLNGLRAVIMFFIALSHIMWLVGTGYTDNPRDFEQAHERVYYQIIFSGMVIVQIFFVVSGCLLGYYLQVLSETKRLTWNFVPKMLLHRWSRLTPGNAIVILFTATWLRHLGSGPLWNLNVTSVATDCRNYWWQHLLFFNNYVKQDKSCAIHSWHVATEMQLFTVGLVAYVATVSRGRYLVLALLGLAGMVGPALHVWLQDLDALVLHRPEFYRAFENDTYRSMHVLGHNNLSCYAIGMATGFISYYCVRNKIEYSSKLLKFLTWCVPPAVVGVFLSGSLFYIDGERPHVAIRMAYAACHRATLGVMIALLILNLVMKFEDLIREFLEWRGWVVISKLSYSVYLLHVNFIHVLLGARTQLSHVSFFHVIINHFGVVSLTFLVSVPFHLMLEAPLLSLTKIALSKEWLESKQKKIE
ncbi:nose resistant to fluoxetine protein 6-like [Epargyreus clarus]|uniref:nose resistant to fluoxetine protein 6-like n=1 Tax=Epargyreus clarus TaxID=520877 RepID=UPI003C2DD279